MLRARKIFCSGHVPGWPHITWASQKFSRVRLLWVASLITTPPFRTSEPFSKIVAETGRRRRKAAWLAVPLCCVRVLLPVVVQEEEKNM